jgi:hypothetical protein
VSHEQDEIPSREHPAHGVLIIDPAIVFVTVCTKHRQPWLANAIVHGVLQHAWKGAHAWLVGRYVIMPDHIHLFSAPSQTSIELDSILEVRLYKADPANGITRHSGPPLADRSLGHAASQLAELRSKVGLRPQ